MDQYVLGLKKLVTLPGSQLSRTTLIIDGVATWLVDLYSYIHNSNIIIARTETEM